MENNDFVIINEELLRDITEAYKERSGLTSKVSLKSLEGKIRELSQHEDSFLSIELTEATGLNFSVNSDCKKDWGDGIIDSQNSHTYDKYGNYLIKLYGLKESITLDSPTVKSVICQPNVNFENCENLELLYISPTNTEIDFNKLGEFKKLKNIIIDPDNNEFERDGDFIVFKNEKSRAVYFFLG